MTRQVKTYNPNHVFVDTRSNSVRLQGKNFTVKDIDSALDQTGADIEDNVQFVLARKQKCRVIITNNYKDYRLLLGAQIIKPSKVRTIAR